MVCGYLLPGLYQLICLPSTIIKIRSKCITKLLTSLGGLPAAQPTTKKNCKILLAKWPAADMHQIVQIIKPNRAVQLLLLLLFVINIAMLDKYTKIFILNLIIS